MWKTKKFLMVVKTQSLNENKDTQSKDIFQSYWSIDRLALKRQMGIEKASCKVLKLFGDITGEQLMKTWNAVGDSEHALSVRLWMV